MLFCGILGAQVGKSGRGESNRRIHVILSLLWKKPTFSLGGYDAEQTIWNHLAWPAILLFMCQHKE
jgi:hypothetical protein